QPRAARKSTTLDLVYCLPRLRAVAGVSGRAEYVPTGDSSPSRNSQRSCGAGGPSRQGATRLPLAPPLRPRCDGWRVVVHGNTLGLAPSELAALERLYRRRVPPNRVTSAELARARTERSAEIGRQVGR